MKEIIFPVVETDEIGAVISTDNFRFKSSLNLQKKTVAGHGQSFAQFSWLDSKSIP